MSDSNDGAMINWTHHVENCPTCQGLIRDEGYTREELAFEIQSRYIEKFAAGE
jgi:hypothetical protein